MSVTYTCPNCQAALKTANAIPAGKRVTCPKCKDSFVPVPADAAAPKEAGAGTFKFADEPAKKPAAAAAAAAKKAAPPKAESPPPPPPPKPDDDDEDAESVRKGYGIAVEADEERMKAEQAKVKFGEIQDKYKKSAKGPAVGLLVMPANLMTGAGLLAAVAGILFFVTGMWPLVFNDAPPGDEEVEEAIMTMFLGLLVFGWGCFICYGASQLSELGSYMWAMAGSIMAIPLLVGIYAVVMLQDPKVKEGFAETEGGPEDEDGAGDGDDDEDEDDEDEDDDD